MNKTTYRSDERISHKGNIIYEVESAFAVLDNFKSINAQGDAMRALALNENEQTGFARTLDSQV